MALVATLLLGGSGWAAEEASVLVTPEVVTPSDAVVDVEAAARGMGGTATPIKQFRLTMTRQDAEKPIYEGEFPHYSLAGRMTFQLDARKLEPGVYNADGQSLGKDGEVLTTGKLAEVTGPHGLSLWARQHGGNLYVVVVNKELRGAGDKWHTVARRITLRLPKVFRGGRVEVLFPDGGAPPTIAGPDLADTLAPGQARVYKVPRAE